jgi:hypothetical protein
MTATVDMLRRPRPKEYPRRYVGISFAGNAKVEMKLDRLPNAICHPVPTTQFLWPSRFMIYQHIMIGIALNRPIV